MQVIRRGATTNTRIAVSGAELALTSSGSGPPVLLLPGGSGGADSYAVLQAELADRYTVIAYDRRGHFRSTGRVDAPMPISRLADDAADVIRQLFGEPVLVFGSSAGAVVALDLAARHPGLVRGVIAHEPPVLHVLPDAGHWQALAEHVIEVNAAGRLDEAHRLLDAMIGLPDPPDAPPLAAERRPEWDHLFRHEWRQLFEYRPDLIALRTIRGRLVMASGADTPDCFQARTARVLAHQLDTRHLVLPGNHIAPALRPQETARALAPVLAELSSRAGLVLGSRGA